METKWIEVSGGIEIPESMSLDEFDDLFIAFMEQHGFHFGGGIKEMEETP